MVISLPKSIIDKCKKFAQERMNDSAAHYRYRGEHNFDKMVEDIIAGTMGEFAVYKYLKSIDMPCTAPDLTIYKARKKSYSADLSTNSFNIHVKSQSVKSIKRYGKSWLFQKSDKIVKDPSLEDLLAFTSVDLENNTVEILGFLSPIELNKKNLWGECKVPKYRHTKLAVYLEDLENAGIELYKIG